MIFIFTTSNKIGSRLIRWGLNSKVSHFAISEANICDAFVIDSTIEQNVATQKLFEFQRKHDVVFAFECPNIDIKISQMMFNKLYCELRNKNYDHKGVAWLGLVVLFCKKLFRRPLPKHNQWADRDDYFCSEIANVIADELEIYCGIQIKSYKQMLTPDVLLNMFLEAEKNGLVKQVYILCDNRQRALNA